MVSVVAPSAPAQTSQRSAAIGWMRVIAIVGVVLIHASGVAASTETLRGTPVFTVALLLNTWALWCVPLFILVSGALLLRPRTMADGPGAFYRRRASRLLAPLIFWNVFYIMFHAIVRHDAVTWKWLVLVVLEGRVYTALYFFWILVGLYILAPFLWAAVRDLSPTARLAVAAGVAAATCTWTTTLGVLTYVGGDANPGTQNIVTLCVPYIGVFMLGGALGELTPTRRAAIFGLLLAVGGSALTVWQRFGGAPRWTWVISPPNAWSWTVVGSTAGVWLFLWWAARPGTFLGSGVPAAIAEKLGVLTLGVFAVHLAVLYFLALWIAPQMAVGSIRLPALLALCTATIVCSWAVAWLMSLVPYLRRVV